MTAEPNPLGGKPPATRPTLTKTLGAISALSGRSRLDLALEMLRLRLGPGKLSPNEYVTHALFDSALYADADKTHFVGFRAAQMIWLRANYRVDFFGLINNKLAANALFAAHGFPVLPTLAMFRERVGRDTPLLVRSVAQLRGFLTTSRSYPLFGKPIDGHQSLGSISLERYDAASDRLITTTGQGLSLDRFLGFVATHATAGYLFQQRVSPHPAVREICGERLATARLLTIVPDGRPKLARACWKIPAGTNTADNFWRPGNLLAELDIASGRVLRVMRRANHGFEAITHHPDSGTPLVGTTVPNWEEISRLALEAARVVEEMPLVGWDIAPVDGGAVLVEPNESPDFKLHQIADRRGILDAEFAAFLAARKKSAEAWLKAARISRREQ